MKSSAFRRTLRASRFPRFATVDAIHGLRYSCLCGAGVSPVIRGLSGKYSHAFGEYSRWRSAVSQPVSIPGRLETARTTPPWHGALVFVVGVPEQYR